MFNHSSLRKAFLIVEAFNAFVAIGFVLILGGFGLGETLIYLLSILLGLLFPLLTLLIKKRWSDFVVLPFLFLRLITLSGQSVHFKFYAGLYYIPFWNGSGISVDSGLGFGLLIGESYLVGSPPFGINFVVLGLIILYLFSRKPLKKDQRKVQ